ncbi:isochorismatase family protein [Bacillus sp. BP-3]|uniref:isochorismatase family protein n=1 Tax=Bacillus sp. BP-3 TaxID=3022773 RepID=UPI00232B7BD4|nr:isochorismatase family protein [Bacillus sp. BP-3]MDC2865082.1 isochorismatase family protein [Bacillus sp. BP-3]
MKQALVVIDVQEIFFLEPQNFLYDKEHVVENINKLITKAHEKNIPVIFIQHTGTEETDEMFEGKDGWQLHKGLVKTSADKVIQKTKWDAFYQTELLDYLQEKEIEQIIFAGAQTEFCLDTTIRAAYSLGYQNNLLSRNTQSTITSAVLEAQQIIQHHENIWNNRFLKIVELDTVL